MMISMKSLRIEENFRKSNDDGGKEEGI